MKIFLYILLSALVVVQLNSAETTKRNSGPIVNVTFDSPPKHLWVVKDPKSKVYDSIVKKDGFRKAGCRVLKFQSEEKCCASFPQYVNVRPGKRYCFSVYAKAELPGDSDEIILSVQPRDALHKQLPAPTPVVAGKTSVKAVHFAKWKRITLELTIPKSDEKWKDVKCLLFLYGAASFGGKVFFDDLEIYEFDESPSK